MRLINKDRLEEKKFIAVELIGYGENVAYRVGWNDAIDAIIENEPTIDAVSVVRCKECKLYEECEYLELGDDDFCSRGEREGE